MSLTEEMMETSLNSKKRQKLLPKEQLLREFNKPIQPMSLPSIDCGFSMNLENPWLSNFINKNVLIDCRNPYELSIQRSEYTRALKWCYDGTKADGLSFRVSQNILLTGFGICRPFKSGKVLPIKTIKLLKGKSTESSLIYGDVKIC